MPKRVLSHAHWTMDRAKMSKSRGNVADPLAAMDKYGADGVRFYLMRTGGALDRDADYSEAELERAFARLQGQLGNLAQRITSPAILGKVGTWDGKTARDEVLDAALRDTRDAYEAKFERYDLTMASESLFTPLYEANRYFQVSEPWAAGAEAAPAIMYAYHSLRVVGILALPILPGKAAELLDRLGVPEEERTWANASWTPDMGGLDTQLIAQRLQQGAERFNRVPLFPSPEGAKPAKGAKSAKVPQQTKNRKDKADRKDKKNKKSTD
jgi:methionyl-tRNA synthetase